MFVNKRDFHFVDNQQDHETRRRECVRRDIATGLWISIHFQIQKSI